MAAATVATAVPAQLLFVDGSFADLAQEMADYLQVGDDVRPLVADNKNEDALAKLVAASAALNSAPEKEFTAASNLMIHLVMQSPEPKKYLQQLCATFAKPVTNSPVHGVGLSLNALTTVFNMVRPDDPVRARVLMEIVKFFKQYGMFDTLRPYLERLPDWFEAWDIDAPFQRRLFEDIAEVAAEAGENEQSYQYILKALRTFENDEVNSEEATRLSRRAVRMALLSPTHYLFQDLIVIPSVEALSDSHAVYWELLDIFAKKDLEDFNDFNEEHDDFIDKEKLDHERLHRKMRLLTFASLAAATPSREIDYRSIGRALQIPAEDVEMWTIDVIRAGLVEGKLSQQKGTFLVHKATYRVFGEKQYRELGTRVDQWRATLRSVIGVLRQEQEAARTYNEREATEADRLPAGATAGDDRHHHHYNQHHHHNNQNHHHHNNAEGRGGGKRGGGYGGNLSRDGGGGGHSSQVQQKERADYDD